MTKRRGPLQPGEPLYTYAPTHQTFTHGFTLHEAIYADDSRGWHLFQDGTRIGLFGTPEVAETYIQIWTAGYVAGQQAPRND